MGIILKLTLCYMKKNKKRTNAAVLAIIVMMVLLTSVHIFAKAFLGMLIDQVIENEGSYHVIFHELTKEQCEALRQSKKVRSAEGITDCELHPGEETLCAKAEMAKVNHWIFGAAQRLAKKIGMPLLPQEDRVEMANRSTAKYQVSYHMELLEYYGITTYGWMGVGLLINVVLAMLIFFGCVLIYNAYAISVFEKLKYLGLLGCVGASRVQRAFVVYWEGIIEGVIGIPAGIGAGFLLSKGILYGIQNYFLYDGISMNFTPQLLGKLVISGWIMIFAACFFPARKAVKTSAMELIVRQCSVKKSVQKKTDLLGRRRFPGTVGLLAVKNVWVRRKSYIANGVVLIITFCLLLDGFAAMRGINGDYYPKDKRERPKLSLWTEIHSSDAGKINAFYEKISEIPKLKQISLERTLDLGGILLSKDALKKDLRNFDTLAGYGYIGGYTEVKDCRLSKTAEGYWYPVSITGLDRITFQEYLKKAGYELSEEEFQKGETYPVLAEDYMEIRTGEESERRSVLDVRPGEELSFLYSRYGDLDPINLGIHKEIDELKEGSFQLIGATKKAPAYPYYSGDAGEPEGHQGWVERGLRFYMPLDAFEALIKSPDYKDTYGIHPEDTKANNYWDEKEILACIKFDIEREKKNGKLSFADKLFHKELSERVREDKETEQTVRKLAAECQVSEYEFGSAAISRKEEYFHSEKLLLQVLGYGMILLILALSLTNILQNISMAMRVRRREFAAYRSMGMESGALKGMLIAENSLYGLAASFIGIPISLFLLSDVFREFGKFQTIERVMPWDIICVQFVIAFVLIAAPTAHTALQFKRLNIIETIRDESI